MVVWRKTTSFQSAGVGVALAKQLQYQIIFEGGGGGSYFNHCRRRARVDQLLAYNGAVFRKVPGLLIIIYFVYIKRVQSAAILVHISPYN